MPISFPGHDFFHAALKLFHPELWYGIGTLHESFQGLGGTEGLAMNCTSLYNALQSIDDMSRAFFGEKHPAYSTI